MFQNQLYIFMEDFLFLFENNNFDQHILLNIYNILVLFINISSIHAYIDMNSI